MSNKLNIYRKILFLLIWLNISIISMSLTNKNKAKLISISKKQLGKPYLYGAKSYQSRNFDCSSFTQYVYKKMGYNLPRTSRQQAKIGRKVSIKQLEKGDLLFFYNKKIRDIGHVAIYIGNNRFIHSSSAKKKVVITVFKGYYRRNFVRAKRVK